MSSNPTSLSFRERITKAAEAAKIKEEDLLAQLAEIGVEPDDDDALEVTKRSHSGIFTKAGAKEARARYAFEILVAEPTAEEKQEQMGLKGTKETFDNSDLAQLLASQRPIEQWKDAELVAEYGAECDSRIGDELHRRSKGRAFVVFDSEGNIEEETTLELLRTARRQDTPGKYQNKAGDLVRVCRVGEFPQTYIEESPIFPDVILVNGFCEEGEVSWKDISDEDRVIVRVAHETVGLSENPFEIEALVDKIKAEGSAKFLLKKSVKLAYEEMKEENRLPRLRKKMSTKRGGGDPFYIHKDY